MGDGAERADGLLLEGIQHVAVLTKDTARFVAFYEEVFGARVLETMEVPFGTLTLLHLGGVGELNLFEVRDNDQADRQTPMFERGRIDHLGLQAASREAFDEIRRRLMARGASDGFVTDFGWVHSLFFVGPDGLEGEVIIQSSESGPSKPPGTPAPGYAVGVP